MMHMYLSKNTNGGGGVGRDRGSGVGRDAAELALPQSVDLAAEAQAGQQPLLDTTEQSSPAVPCLGWGEGGQTMGPKDLSTIKIFVLSG